MSVDHALGLLRSIAIYQASPLCQRRLRRLYSQFVATGDLVFDVGAHVGNRTRAFEALGCRIEVREPQSDFARCAYCLRDRCSGGCCGPP